MSNVVTVLVLGVVASLMGDPVWYQLGRSRGHKVLKLLCKLSLEPDSCVRRTENLFARHGDRALLLAKFIPGFGVAIPPMAGPQQYPRPRPAAGAYWQAQATVGEFCSRW
jgi:membrane protein DedA with SNARE-associated domain